jgi:putative membrane protein
VKFWLRWLADGIAIFLALYLMDSLLHERFHLEATWAGVLAAIILGFLNSFVRPLHRVRSKPQRAALIAVLTLLVNAFILQLFVWVGADVTSRGFIWVLLAAALATVVSGLINWQIGFGRSEKPRTGVRERPGASSGGREGRKPDGPEGRRPARSTQR